MELHLELIPEQNCIFLIEKCTFPISQTRNHFFHGILSKQRLVKFVKKKTEIREILQKNFQNSETFFFEFPTFPDFFRFSETCFSNSFPHFQY